MTNRNAFIGMDVERLFKNSIKSRSNVLRALRDHFRIDGEFAAAYSTGTDAGKSDVVLKFSDGRTLSANIKAFKAGFNQITRLKIGAFCQRFGLETLTEIFEQAAIRVAGKKGRFILDVDEGRLFKALNPIAATILKFAIATLENPELLVLFDRTANRMLIYDLDQILNTLDYRITFSKRGIIRIGEYFTIQRKGGNGVHSRHIEKTSLDHPGNNLQIKMNIRSFVAENIPLVTYEP
jgi:hypothetical protein